MACMIRQCFRRCGETDDFSAKFKFHAKLEQREYERPLCVGCLGCSSPPVTEGFIFVDDHMTTGSCASSATWAESSTTTAEIPTARMIRASTDMQPRAKLCSDMNRYKSYVRRVQGNDLRCSRPVCEYVRGGDRGRRSLDCRLVIVNARGFYPTAVLFGPRHRKTQAPIGAPGLPSLVTLDL